MLTNKTLARINNRPRKVGRLPLLAVGGGIVVLTALLYVFEVLPSFAILAVIGGGAFLVLLLYRTQKAKTTISLLQGQARRRSRLALLFRTGGSGGSRLIREDQAPA